VPSEPARNISDSELAVAAPNGWIQKERDASIYNYETSFWAKEASLPSSDQPITLTVALRLDVSRRADLERVFEEVSNPDHENYGKHLTIERITELLAVPSEQVERVRSHFVTAGATEAIVAPNRDMITVTMPVAVAEAAMLTKIHFFTHKKHLNAPRILRASRAYHLPLTIADDVSMVGELLQFPLLPRKELQNLKTGSGSWPNSCSAAGCKGLVTPSVIAQRYKLPEPSSVLDNSTSNSMAVAEFQGQYFEPKDISSFGTSCHRAVTVDKIIGGNQPSAGIECELDIEYIKSVAPEVPLTMVYDAQYSLLSWANQIVSLATAPLVNSVSYGNDEAQQSSKQYMYTCNTAFMKAGARGLSILFASGDQGVCGREGCGIFKKSLKPDFPGGSPYITVVGGTNFLGNDIGEETTWNDGGGGFSNTFPSPAYQKDAVAKYLSNKAALPPQKYWNATGRGYPDVAALAGQKAPYCIASSGQFEGVAGTSAACPVVAGVFAKLNGLRLKAGKPPMGFLNPFIYKNPSAFQDVTTGDNGAGTKLGFHAVAGWDAATGFGTPDFEALSKAVMAAEDERATATMIVV